MGHVIDEQGVSPDPHKTSAIVAMERPKTPTELRRFLDMVNQLGKFTPNIAEMSQPLRELLSSKKSWVWGPPQESAFERELTQPTVLALYNPDANLKISTDASSLWVGSGAPPAALSHTVEASGTCFSVHERNGTEILTN